MDGEGAGANLLRIARLGLFERYLGARRPFFGVRGRENEPRGGAAGKL